MRRAAAPVANTDFDKKEETATMKKRIFASAMALAMALSLLPVSALAAEGEDTTENTATSITQNYTLTSATTGGNFSLDGEDITLTIQGEVALDGDGDAFTINADATLVFAEGASLTLTGYDNAFVVENATLSGGGWVINDGDGMDLFRLKTSGKLNITSDVVLSGNGATDTTSRAIVLPGSGAQNQAIHLAANTTLEANDFYRGVETGGASNYTISGENRDTSVFDFSENDCGMYLSYFDSNAHFNKCKLEVSNCTTSGIFMRQDNASLNGLYIDNVFINCVNDELDNQEDIAIRFHTVNFEIKDSVINIENAWNTGLWICDGWDKNGTKEISDTTISVKKVYGQTELYGGAMRRKAITLVPYGEFLIDGCEIIMEGSGSDTMEGGLNIASDIQLNRSTMSAKPTIVDGTVKLQNTEIYTSRITGADVGVQVGQFLEIGENVVIENDHNDTNWTEHFTVLCDDYNNGYPGQILGIPFTLQYDVSNLTEAQKSPNRLTVTGGNYWSTRDPNLKYLELDNCLFYEASIPVNVAGEDLTMFEVTSDAYSTYVTDDKIVLRNSDGSTYDYKAAVTADGQTSRYIWAPAVTVTLVDTDGTSTEIKVPRGPAFGLTQTLENGNWVTNDGDMFTESTEVTEDITITNTAQ